jgi:hypothetical protein
MLLFLNYWLQYASKAEQRGNLYHMLKQGMKPSGGQLILQKIGRD